MKILIATAILFLLAGCATTPRSPEARYAFAHRACLGQTANAQGHVISQLESSSDRDYPMTQCLRRYGIRD